MKDRATTPFLKVDVMERLYAAWLEAPYERFGQFLLNCANDKDLFNIEDFELVRRAEERTKR